MTKPDFTPRATYKHLHAMTTRWRDNDVYAHMNNVVFYEYVDTVVNHWLIGAGLVVPDGPCIGLVVESACTFRAPLGFPDPVAAGLGTTRVGRTSITYQVGLFRGDAAEAAAQARFTHVYVEAAGRRPMLLPQGLRREALAIAL
ncbi:MAG: thioesterase family protein [Pseudomonadota bacterium]